MFRLPLLIGISTALHASLLLYANSRERAQLPLHIGQVSVTLDAAPGGTPQQGKPAVQPTPIPPVPAPEPPEPLPPRPVAPLEPTVERTDLDPLPVAPQPEVLHRLDALPEPLPVVVPRPAPAAPAPVPAVQVAGAPAASVRPQGARTRAALTSHQKPTYPPEAHRRGLQGDVLVWLHVGSDGRIVRAQLHQSSGHALLDDAAVAFARTLTLRPAREGGRPVASHELLPVYFRLIDP